MTRPQRTTLSATTAHVIAFAVGTFAFVLLLGVVYLARVGVIA